MSQGFTIAKTFEHVGVTYRPGDEDKLAKAVGTSKNIHLDRLTTRGFLARAEATADTRRAGRRSETGE